MAENNNLGIDLELDETVAQGNYSNLAIIAHSTSEFIIDFAAVMPAVPKAKVKSRIILTPEHAKRLLMSLQENIVRYESVHGADRDPHAAAYERAVRRQDRRGLIAGRSDRISACPKCGSERMRRNGSVPFRRVFVSGAPAQAWHRTRLVAHILSTSISKSKRTFM